MKNTLSMQPQNSRLDHRLKRCAWENIFFFIYIVYVLFFFISLVIAFFKANEESLFLHTGNNVDDSTESELRLQSLV